MSTFPCEGYSRSILSFAYLETIFRINIIEISIIAEDQIQNRTKGKILKEQKYQKGMKKENLVNLEQNLKWIRKEYKNTLEKIKIGIKKDSKSLI